MKRLITIMTGVMALSLCAIAGWEHSSGKTYWVDRPTPATCWLRLANGDLQAAKKVMVYPDTIIYYQYIPDANTNQVPAFGFWTVDSDGDYVPDSSLSSGDCTTNQSGVNGKWTDVEWDVDGDGDLTPKK